MKYTKAIIYTLSFLLILSLSACTTDNSVSDTPNAEIDNVIRFPDSNFEAAVRNVIGKPDGDITQDDVAEITSLHVSGCDIKDLTGIEYFTALEALNCISNQLTSLDVSKNTALRFLECNSNQLTVLDVSKNTALYMLVCRSNKLTSLDVSGCVELEMLDCLDNQLTALDVSSCTALIDINCRGNQLTSLDVSNNTILGVIDCRENNIPNLSSIIGLGESRPNVIFD